jgi:protein SCO1/2
MLKPQTPMGRSVKIVAWCSILLVGCSSGDERKAQTEPADSTAVAVQTYEGRGLVISVMPNREHIVVDHEDIPGFMSAMKMPFALKDTSVASGVSEGDSIRFTVEVDGPYIHIVRMEVED